MYVPEHFSEKNINEIKKLIDNYPLATLFTSGINGFTANHLPFLIDFNANGTQTILGHIARNNQLFKENKNKASNIIARKIFVYSIFYLFFIFVLILADNVIQY